MHQPSGNNLKGFLLSLTAAILWGILPIALKELVQGMDAATIVWYRFLVSAVVLLAYLGLAGKLPRWQGRPTHILVLLAVAGVGLCANYVLFSASLNHLNAESSEALIQLTTLFLLLGGVLFYGEPFYRTQQLGSALIVVGLILFFHDRWAELLTGGSGFLLGVAMVVAAAVTWVIYALLQKLLLRSFSSVQILLMIYLLSVLLLLPLVSPLQLFSLDGLQLGLLLFCCLNTLAAYGGFAEALVHWHASKVSAVLALAPLFTLAGVKVVIGFNPDYAYTDHLSSLAVFAALILVSGSIAVALVPLYTQRKIDPPVKLP